MRAWITISALLALLVVAAYVGYVGWNLTDVATMMLGIIFSIIVGVGLMGLMFYSSRHGYDEPSSSRRDGSLSDHKAYHFFDAGALELNCRLSVTLGGQWIERPWRCS
jgi:hypothetical protein